MQRSDVARLTKKQILKFGYGKNSGVFNMKKFAKIIAITILILSKSAYAQQLVCLNSGYENIMHGGNNKTRQNSVMVVSVSNGVMHIEKNNTLSKTTFKELYEITHKSDGEISGYNRSAVGTSTISSVSINLKINIASHVTLNPFGASVAHYECSSR